MECLDCQEWEERMVALITRTLIANWHRIRTLALCVSRLPRCMDHCFKVDLYGRPLADVLRSGTTFGEDHLHTVVLDRCMAPSIFKIHKTIFSTVKTREAGGQNPINKRNTKGLHFVGWLSVALFAGLSLKSNILCWRENLQVSTLKPV